MPQGWLSTSSLCVAILGAVQRFVAVHRVLRAKDGAGSLIESTPTVDEDRVAGQDYRQRDLAHLESHAFLFYFPNARYSMCSRNLFIARLGQRPRQASAGILNAGKTLARGGRRDV